MPNIFAGYNLTQHRIATLLKHAIDNTSILGTPPPIGLLLHGPSGCGKTLLVSALASSLSLNFVKVKGSDLFGKYFGETEEKIRHVFRLARRKTPCLLLLDEVDMLGQKRGIFIAFHSTNKIHSQD